MTEKVTVDPLSFVSRPAPVDDERLVSLDGHPEPATPEVADLGDEGQPVGEGVGLLDRAAVRVELEPLGCAHDGQRRRIEPDDAVGHVLQGSLGALVPQVLEGLAPPHRAVGGRAQLEGLARAVVLHRHALGIGRDGGHVELRTARVDLPARLAGVGGIGTKGRPVVGQQDETAVRRHGLPEEAALDPLAEDELRRPRQQGEERTVGLGAALDAHRLQGGEHRDVRVVLVEGRRGEPLGISGDARRGRPLARRRRLGARPPGEQAGHERHDEEDCRADEEGAQAAVLPGRAGGPFGDLALLGLRPLPGRVDEVALDGGDLVRPSRDQLQGPREPGAAPERRVLAPFGVPLVGREGEAALDSAARRVLGEPGRQPRPLPEERLVGDLDVAVGDGEQPGLGQPVGHPALVRRG